MKGKKIVLWSLGIILVLVAIVYTYVYFKVPIKIGNPVSVNYNGKVSLSEDLTKIQVKEDGEKLIKIVEDTHPAFLETVSEKYKKEKENFLSKINNPMKASEFQLICSKYLSSLEDGHTVVYWNENKYLNVNWLYLNNNLTLLDENNKPTNKIIEKINNVEIGKIINTVNEIFPAENYSAKNVNNTETTKGKLLLETAGVDCTKDMILTTKNGEKIKVEFKKEINSQKRGSEIYYKTINNKTGYIRLGVCDVNSELETVLKSINENINNLENVIIDVIDNPGGNSLACTKILDALKMKPGHFGSVIRFSKMVKESGYLRSSGSITIKPSNKSEKNQNINLYVLTNENSFSSAMDLATLVQDGKLGKIIGRASSNMPSSYGDVLRFKLDNSNIVGQISFKKWTRPDISKDKERALEPDIKVEYGEDIVEKALEIIK